MTVRVDGAPAVGDGPIYRLDLNLLPGLNTVVVRAVDAAGNHAEATYTFRLDTGAPALTIAAPADNAVVTSRTITVTGTVADDDLAAVTVNGRPVELGSGGYHAEVSLAEGTNHVTVEAADTAGNTATKRVTVTADTAPPAPFAPAANHAGWTNDRTPRLVFATTDFGTGVVRYDLRIDGGEWLPDVRSPYTLAAIERRGAHGGSQGGGRRGTRDDRRLPGIHRYRRPARAGRF